jgi:xylan 1,4-beta-xylosidase
VLADGVRGPPDIGVTATRAGDQVAALIWNYHDDDLPGDGGAEVSLEVFGLSGGSHGLRHFRMDGGHSNAHARWLAIGSPEAPSPEAYRRLETASELETLEPECHVTPSEGAVRLDFFLPRHAVSLVLLTPA